MSENVRHSNKAGFEQSVRFGKINRDRLADSAQRGDLYVLVDPAYDSIPFPNSARLEIRDTDPEFFEMIAWEQVRYVAPRLIRIPDEFLSIFLDMLSTERWGVFVESQIGQAALKNHLSRFIIAKGPDSNPYFLRYQDPSVLQVLLSTWSSHELAKFFGPIDGFGFNDLDTGEIEYCPSPLSRRSRREVEPEACLLSLSRAQLEQCGEQIDRDLKAVVEWHLRMHHTRAVLHIPQDILRSRVEVAIQRARSYGLSTLSDISGFAALMFEVSPVFDSHPAFERVLASPDIASEGKLKILSKTLTPDQWREAHGLQDPTFWARAKKRA